MNWRALVFSSGMLILAACSSGYERQVARLKWFVGWNQIGVTRDVWLVKHNAFGMDEETVLIFGYWDDWSFCQELAEMYMQRYPLDRYRCSFAN